jgi:hypothetical protein
VGAHSELRVVLLILGLYVGFSGFPYVYFLCT